jgi:hypothetical protein
VQGAGCKVRVQGAKCRVLGVRIIGFGSRALCLGFTHWGLGLRA